jgi:phospholipase C
MTRKELSRRELLAALAAAGLGGGLAVACSDHTTSARKPAVTSTTSTTTVPGKPRPPGSRPFPSRPEGAESLTEVEHIVVYMQENHSYDNYFGMLKRGDGFTVRNGVPIHSNPGLDGAPVPLTHKTEFCDVELNASQTWANSYTSINGGAMDGFVRAAPGGAHGSMGYWDGDDIPFYYSLASHFPICDRWFCSVPAQTFPNRRFLQAATSVGILTTDIHEVLATPDAPNGLIWDRLNAHGITWTDYGVDLFDILLFPDFYAKNMSHTKPFQQFLTDCHDDTLPQVSIISPGDKLYTEERPADLAMGEAYSAVLINALMQSPAWEKTVMFFTYDEHGGYYDHVAPPRAVVPDGIAPRYKPTDPQVPPGPFGMYGPRVPGFVISPFAKKDYVSHVVHDHTSILKFIETKFNLGAMTYRDANADDLMDCLDFRAAAFRDPPTLAKPHLVPPAVSACQPDVPPLPTIPT